MPSSPIAWLWLVAFIVAAWFVYSHWVKGNLPGS